MLIRIRASIVRLQNNKIIGCLQKTNLSMLVVSHAKLRRTCGVLFRKELYIFNVSEHI